MHSSVCYVYTSLLAIIAVLEVTNAVMKLTNQGQRKDNCCLEYQACNQWYLDPD